MGFLFAVIAGAAMSVQGVMNTRLSEKIGLYESNAWVQGTAFILSLLAVWILGKGDFAKLGQTPKYTLLGGALGLYGILLGATLLLCSICAIHILGIPYTAPVSPLTFRALKDVIIRADWRQLWKDKFRVQNVKGSDIRDDGQEP